MSNDCNTYIRLTPMHTAIEQPLLFEFELEKHNFQARACRADNGRFANLGLKEEVRKFNQVISCCGFGSHGKNGIVERHVVDVST